MINKNYIDKIKGYYSKERPKLYIEYQIVKYEMVPMKNRMLKSNFIPNPNKEYKEYIEKTNIFIPFTIYIINLILLYGLILDLMVLNILVIIIIHIKLRNKYENQMKNKLQYIYLPIF